ncbi:hypothetical protein TIFTF001_031652 [Ficus carica]|uniref:Uncharacterized protein n=1 Tax=Ficus carica TaxID=3494 RepID=A0AA88J5R6_FICCA|nr:hypothetical protein TIFTF001_031652 [Ficus carica]
MISRMQYVVSTRVRSGLVHGLSWTGLAAPTTPWQRATIVVLAERKLIVHVYAVAMVASVVVKSDQGNLKTDKLNDGESRAQRKILIGYTWRVSSGYPDTSGPLDVLRNYITLHIPIFFFLFLRGAFKRSESEFLKFLKLFEFSGKIYLLLLHFEGFASFWVFLWVFWFVVLRVHPNLLGISIQKTFRSEVSPSFVQNSVCDPMDKEKQSIGDVDVEWTSTDSSDSSSDNEELMSTIHRSRFEHDSSTTRWVLERVTRLQREIDRRQHRAKKYYRFPLLLD